MAQNSKICTVSSVLFPLKLGERYKAKGEKTADFCIYLVQNVNPFGFVACVEIISCHNKEDYRSNPMSKLSLSHLPKDFIETKEGLCFAVVQSGTERCGGQEWVLCFLRYIKDDAEINRPWRKVSTEQANEYLGRHFPHYLYHSAVLDANLHAVATDQITQHHCPRRRLQQLLSNQQRDKVEQDVYDLCLLFQNNGLDLTNVGITGSVLIGAQHETSDIDLVMYDRDAFHKARTITGDLIDKQQLANLADADWQEAYARRSCTLSLTEYVWHERRKFNKGLINGRKFDLNFVADNIGADLKRYQKLGAITLQCNITDDGYAFDYPSLYAIDHDTITTVVCFIATYTGQAIKGETVEISGLLEQAEDGKQRIVVGSSREAPSEYIKVVSCHD
jgi:predicted nucleotidyltransferase